MTAATYSPRYREIESALRARIATLRPGQRLPSDADLCAEFGVSRMTARHAMAQLAEEGLVRRDPGRGTFVAEPPTHRRANFLMTFSHEMRRQGRVPTSRIIRRLVRPPTEPERGDLRVARGEEVVELCRVRLADGEPVAAGDRGPGTPLRPRGPAGRPRDRLAPRGAHRRRHRAIARQGVHRRRGGQPARTPPCSGSHPASPCSSSGASSSTSAGDHWSAPNRAMPPARYGLDVGFSVEDSGAVTVAPRA